MKRPAAGRSAAVSESYLPPGASLPPPVLLPASDLGSVDLHPGRPRTKKSKRKSRVNLGQSEVRKKRMEPAPQSEEALQNAGIVCEENLQPCADQVRGSARARDCTQEPRATQKAVSPCANLLDSEGDTAQLKGSEPCGSDTLSCLRAKLDDLKVRLGGEKAMPILPGPSGSRGARAWARTERTSEVLKTLRKRLSLGDPTSENVTTKTPSQEADDAVVTLAKAIRRLIKGGSVGSGSGVSGEEENEDSLEQPFLAAPARACQDLNIQARRFPAVSSRMRYAACSVSWGPGWEPAQHRRSSPVCLRTSRQSSINVTRRSVLGSAQRDAYAGRGHRLPPGRRQHEDGRPLDPAVQGGGDVRIRRSWSLARHLELIPEEGVGLTSPAERISLQNSSCSEHAWPKAGVPGENRGSAAARDLGQTWMPVP